MTAPDLIARDVAAVKTELLDRLSDMLEPLLRDARYGTLSAREAELQTWTLIVSLGAAVLTSVWSCMCRCATEKAIADWGWSMDQVRLRTDADYLGKINTTFGRLRFPWFAFRDPAGRTRAPARELFPNHPKIRSSELLVEWECALAADHPFRKAADALLFFSHGAADVEDTTIQRHAIQVGSALPVHWLYRTPEDIRELLRDHATCDRQTGKPIIYASTDAHALKRFIDETWDPKWRMTNGIRLWCIDRDTGKTLHIGGEYTWGDCNEVARRFVRLRTSGHLPLEGDYGEGVVAQIALLTDGLDWIADHVLPLFPSAVLSLDPYHVIEQVTDTAARLYPNAKNKAKSLIQRGRKAIGMRDRRGRTKLRKGPNRLLQKNRRFPSDGSGQQLLDVLLPIDEELVQHEQEAIDSADLDAIVAVRKKRKRLDNLIGYVRRNLHRLDYGALRKRGFQIGSGAMESLHRTASQVRLKRAGCHWTAEAAQAIMDLRLLTLSGRWDEYWNQPVLPHLSEIKNAA